MSSKPGCQCYQLTQHRESKRDTFWTRSQCKSCRSRVTWSYLRDPKTNRAAAFRTDCSFSKRRAGRQARVAPPQSKRYSTNDAMSDCTYDRSTDGATDAANLTQNCDAAGQLTMNCNPDKSPLSTNLVDFCRLPRRLHWCLAPTISKRSSGGCRGEVHQRSLGGLTLAYSADGKQSFGRKIRQLPREYQQLLCYFFFQLALVFTTYTSLEALSTIY